MEGIGNNVTLEFAGMDFGPAGAGRLVVYGRTPLAKNTIHLLFSGAVGESRQIIEFPVRKNTRSRPLPWNGSPASRR